MSKKTKTVVQRLIASSIRVASVALMMSAASTMQARADTLNMPTLVGWGGNGYGQLNTPANLSGVTQVACGWYHTYALKNDGTLVGWGWNDYGQTNTPSNLSGVTQVACGGYHTYALKNDGTLVGWGPNGSAETNTPSNLSGVTQVAAGATHTVALKYDRTVVAWGSNFVGQTTVPANVSGITQIAASANNTIALRNDGTVIVWGSNFWSQAVPPGNLNSVRQVATGGGFTSELGFCVALKNNGTVVAWGSNFAGQTSVPPDLGGVMQVVTGSTHVVALIEGDCDNDGLLDSSQIAAIPSLDQNSNNLIDKCEISRGWEEDCNNNGVFDSFEQSLNQPAAADSGALPRIGFGHAQQWVYASPSLSLNDPVLTIRAYGDFGAPGETLTVTLNGRFVGTFLADGADKNDCRSSIWRTVTLPRAFYNECVAAPGGATDAIFDFATSVAVNADQCPLGSWVRAEISYTAAVAGDCNANSLLDGCEIALDPSLDANTDGVIDACQGTGVVFLCPGDLDGGGSVDTGDLSLLLMSFGAAMPGDPADLDASGQIDTADLSLLLLSFGDC